jgi:hypothetical protein
VPAEAVSGNFFTHLFGGIFSGKEKENAKNDGAETAESEKGAAPAVTASSETALPFASGASGEDGPIEVDWEPDKLRPDFAQGALDAKGLAPASYLVECTRAMTNENIVSSAVAMIASGNLWDDDVDAVLTRELVTFTLNEDKELGLTVESTFSDSVPRLTPHTEKGATGRSARTFDEMNPLFWIGIAASALFAAVLILILWYRRKRRKAAESNSGRRRSK